MKKVTITSIETSHILHRSKRRARSTALDGLSIATNSEGRLLIRDQLQKSINDMSSSLLTLRLRQDAAQAIVRRSTQP